MNSAERKATNVIEDSKAEVIRRWPGVNFDTDVLFTVFRMNRIMNILGGPMVFVVENTVNGDKFVLIVRNDGTVRFADMGIDSETAVNEEFDRLAIEMTMANEQAAKAVYN